MILAVFKVVVLLLVIMVMSYERFCSVIVSGVIVLNVNAVSVLVVLTVVVVFVADVVLAVS